MAFSTRSIKPKAPLQADLHLHTFYSDGTFSPEEVVDRAKRLNLTAISITDHDSIEGIPAAAVAAGDDLEVIPGVELTAVFGQRELHLLGYGVSLDSQTFNAFLAQKRRLRQDRIRSMIGRLKERGIEVAYEEVLAIAGKGALGRPHLAEVLVKRKVVSSLQEAFHRFIGDTGPCFVRAATVDVPQAIRMIHQAGGVAVLAHPYRLVEDDQIPQLVEMGIEGMEVYHSEHPLAVVDFYRAVAERHQLLVTGGSDCHGYRKPKGPLIGTVTIHYRQVEQLKAAMVHE